VVVSVVSLSVIEAAEAALGRHPDLSPTRCGCGWSARTTPCPDKVALLAIAAAAREAEKRTQAAYELLEFGHDPVNGSWQIPPDAADVDEAGRQLKAALSALRGPREVPDV
jgi:hypothetical protein